MFRARPRRREASPPPADELRELAQRKVQAALEGFGQTTTPAADRTEVAPQAQAPAAPLAAAAYEPVGAATPLHDTLAAQAPGQATPDQLVDPLVQQGVELLRAELGELTVVDASGRRVPVTDLVRVVLGPLGTRLRDADTVAALNQALTEAAEARHARELEWETRSTGWPF